MKRLSSFKRPFITITEALAAMLLGAPAILMSGFSMASEPGKPWQATTFAGAYQQYSTLRNEQPGIPGKLYACNLRATSSMCREYRAVMRDIRVGMEDLSKKATKLSDGCQSMGGIFSTEQCPQTEIIARCNNIVYNEHDPQSPIYNNFYYHADSAALVDADIQRICFNLGGVFEK